MLNTQKAARHATFVAAAVHGPTPAAEIDSMVRHSWTRCLDHYALHPDQAKKANIVERADLQLRRDRHGQLLAIARVELLSLRQRLLNSDFGIMLTDQDGVILHYVGDPNFSSVARRSGLREGAIWSERELGTNGMGTCIIEQRPVMIRQHEHFLAQNTDLTCSAAPIFDAQGRIVAALDISCSYSKAQTHTLALVEIAAQNIENRTLLDSCKREHLIRFHRHAEFISTPGEGIVAFDGAGIITGANRSALEMLGHRNHASLCGQPVEAVFETSLPALMQLSTRNAFRPVTIASRHGAHKLWASIQPPEREARIESAARREALASPDASGSALAAMDLGDPTMASNVRTVRRVVDRDIPILLLGETGSGKGCFAKAIHAAGNRADKPFVTVNCAAIPETLIESELFGYKAGAFTGATREGNPGRIVQANGGTLFLDEIGDMPLPLQVRLLSVIEDREVMPLGGSKAIPVDIRIISATHCDLTTLVREHKFREDLYYRLNGVSLRMPALRDRQDRRELIRSVLREEARQHSTMRIDEAAMTRLLDFDWPGNLRQLRNTLRTMIAMSDSDCLTLADFNEEWVLGGMRPASPAAAHAHAPTAISEADDVLGDAERDALRRVLDNCRWNVSAAAIQLHVSRKTLYRKMLRHGITRRELREPVLASRSTSASNSR